MPADVEIPALGESITQATLLRWHKQDGERVVVDEPLCELETDKANVDLPANSAGVLRRLKNEGDTVNVGEVIARIEENGSTAAGASAAREPAKAPEANPSPAPVEDHSPAVRRLIAENKLDPKKIPATGPGGRLTKEDVERFVAEKPVPPVRAAPELSPPKPAPQGVRRVPMTRIRKRIAETLVQAKQTAAILTTFNEVDLTEVISLRNRFKERFQEVHGVGLGFMSFFARATVQSLRETPAVNAFIEGDDIVYHDYVNLGIAVSTERGLAVPVLRNVQDMSFGRIESEIKRLATAVREGKLEVEDLSGATFTITNGGVFGSLLSTPILTPPQSGILGMHTIQKRPVVINDRIEARPMMYIALSYDHRLVDGREAITFLVRVKQLLEDPARLMLEV